MECRSLIQGTYSNPEDPSVEELDSKLTPEELEKRIKEVYNSLRCFSESEAKQ